jgi:5-methylcytosine-specific restriction endonuclease McrA
LVGYEADVVEWFDKASLSPQDAERIDRRITQYQPSERGLHLAAPGQAQSANLLGIVGLRAVVPPIAVAGFTKISDNLPLGDRTRSGGWSYVVAPAVRADFEVVPESVLRAEEAKEAKRAAKLSRDERRAALLASNPMPERVSVLTTVFRRNQLVIFEVLERAGGVCEGCGRPAPFLRASDGTPYLEVHHLVTLANGGPDTVTNAIALCPNCHRQRHSGQVLP